MITFYQYLQQFHEIIMLDNPEIEKQMKPYPDWSGGKIKGFNMDIDDSRFSCYLKEKELSRLSGMGTFYTDNTLTIDYLNAGFPPFFYEIYFAGYNINKINNLGGMDLKNIYGAKATLIYNFMLISIKKAIETFENEGKPVNIIKYFGVDPTTDAMYHKFFEQYLKNDYIRVDRYYIMKKEIFKQLADKNNELINKQAQVEKDFQDHLDLVREIRKQRRKDRVQVAQEQQP